MKRELVVGDILYSKRDFVYKNSKALEIVILKHDMFVLIETYYTKNTYRLLYINDPKGFYFNVTKEDLSNFMLSEVYHRKMKLKRIESKYGQ